MISMNMSLLVLTNKFSGLMSRCTIESECRYAIADVRWPISKRAWGSENLEAAAILSNKSPPRNTKTFKVLLILSILRHLSFTKSYQMNMKKM